MTTYNERLKIAKALYARPVGENKSEHIRKGLPGKLEQELIDAIVPILKKYRDMRKLHMSKDRINGIAIGALQKASKIGLWNDDEQDKCVAEVIINPGSGPCHDAQEAFAIENIKQFVKDCEMKGLEWERRPELDMGGGRFAFIVRDDKLSFEIQMPGLPLAKVRFMGEPGQNLPDFPRLYKDKSSWWWKWALINKRRYEEKLERN